MPIISHRTKLAYFDVPKVANTSIKRLFWAIEHDVGMEAPATRSIGEKLARRLLPSRFGAKNRSQPKTIHAAPGFETESFASSEPIPGSYQTLAVIRDPILRLHSAWRDKVNKNQFRGREELQDLRNEGLSPDPSFGEFIDHFETYRFVSRPARVHTYGYRYHLGPDISYFDHLFRIEEIAQLNALLSQRIGEAVAIPHLNRSAVDERDDSLTAAQRDRLLQLTSDDYAWLAGAYEPGRALVRLGIDPHG